MNADPEPITDKPKFSESWHEWLKIGLPILVLTCVAFAIAWHFVKPAPPKHVVIATGSHEGMYYKFAQLYAGHFAANGIELEVRETGGSVENYKLLTAPDSGVDVAIVQSGTAPPADQRPNLQAVAGIYYEPVWVFYRGSTPVTRLTQLAGKKIAIGAEGSGVRPLALTLLKDSGLDAGDSQGTTFSDLGGDKAASALKDGTVDAAFFVIAVSAPVIPRLLQTDGVHLMSFELAHAYGRHYPFLSPVTLYEGALDAQRNLPAQDVQLIAPAATLVMRSSTHQAVVELLVQAALQTHGGSTLLSEPGQFPTAERTELPVSSDARFFLTNKPSFLHRTLPFWLASLIDRLLIMLLPFVAVLVPLVRLTPPLYRWSIRKRIFRWYRRVRGIDERLGEHATPDQVESGRRELADLEKEVLSTKVPLSYNQELYNLRLHLGYVRSRLKEGGGRE